MTGNSLQRLISAVETHYAAPDASPLLLSKFGQQNRELLAELKDEFGSLKAAIRATGEDRIRLIETTVGREAVAPAAMAADLQVQLQGDAASQRQGANLFDSLPTPIQIAFCVRTDAGEHVAIDTVRPFRFAKVTAPELIRPTQRIVPDRYRRPGLLLRTATVHERETLWRLFLAWAEEAKVDPASFRQGEASTALGRLLAAQPADIIPRLVVPADIAQILLKHS